MGFWRETGSTTAPRWGLSRYSLAGALLAAGLLAVAAVLVVGAGGSRHAGARAQTPARAALAAVQGATPAATSPASATPPSSAHPRTGAGAAAGLAGAGAGAGASADGAGAHTGAGGRTAGGVVGAASAGRATVAETPDPEASKSFPAPRSVHHKAATAPSTAAEAVVAPGAPSDAEVRRELGQMHAAERAAQRQTLATVPGGGSIGGNGTIAAPPGIPAVVARVIAGANAIADFPYVFGGGHASFVDNAYDCSGSVSYALAAGGLVGAPETSGTLESWGAAGPGKWITVYANAGHTYMYVNLGGGWIRYDTSGRSGVFASRWQPAIRSNEGFVARHWPGL